MDAVKILKLLVCFKKPELIHLSYINVLVKEKPILFIVWEVKNGWSVKFIPLKRRYHEASNALVLSIPEELNEITLKAANFWRKTRITFTMCAVELDRVATAQLIHDFWHLNKVEALAPLVLNIKNKATIKPVSIKQRNSFIKKIDRFNINIQPFNYP
jgi:hypothetical protein